MTDLTERLGRAQIGGCSCGTKSPDRQYHAPLCHYRLHSEAVDEIDRLRAVLQTIVDSHDARSELYTNDADCTGNLAEHARAAL